MTAITFNDKTQEVPVQPAITREGWLMAAVDYFRPRFAELGMPIPEELHISIGFGYGAKAESRFILGQCWARRASADEVNHIFIAPMEHSHTGDAHDNEARMLATLVHELVHSADDNAHGHAGAFKTTAVALGLEGKMTATVPGAALNAELLILAEALGPFPHSPLDVGTTRIMGPLGPGGKPVPGGGKPASGPPKQGTRMRKVVCNEQHEDPALDGYAVRTTTKWLDLGVPSCPAGHAMTVVEPT